MLITLCLFLILKFFIILGVDSLMLPSTASSAIESSSKSGSKVNTHSHSPKAVTSSSLSGINNSISQANLISNYNEFSNLALSLGQHTLNSASVNNSSFMSAAALGLLSVNTAGTGFSTHFPGKPLLSSPKNRGRPRKDPSRTTPPASASAAVPLSKGLGVKIKRLEG
jgi:hypothetical protein